MIRVWLWVCPRLWAGGVLEKSILTTTMITTTLLTPTSSESLWSKTRLQENCLKRLILLFIICWEGKMPAKLIKIFSIKLWRQVHLITFLCVDGATRWQDLSQSLSLTTWMLSTMDPSPSALLLSHSRLCLTPAPAISGFRARSVTTPTLPVSCTTSTMLVDHQHTRYLQVSTLQGWTLISG